MLDARPVTRPAPRNGMILTAVVFIGFLVFGFSENVKGPALPRLQRDFGLDEMQIGLLLSLNSLGYLLACSFTGYLAEKIGIKRTCLIAFGSMAASGVLIYWSFTASVFAGSYFLMYIGNGMLEIALAILAARIFVTRTGTMMNLAHFFYGLSSAAAPVAAAALMGMRTGAGTLDWRGMYLVMLSLAILPMLPSLFARFPDASDRHAERTSYKAYVRDPVAWAIVVILSFGVISEMAVGAWLVNYVEKVYKWEPSASAGMLSAFFICFMLARLVLGPVTDRIGYLRSVWLFSAFSGACTLLAVFLGEPAVFLFALAGIGIAPVYPTVMALLAKQYPNGTSAAITFTVTLMGVFGVLGNLLIGSVTDAAKSFFTAGRGPEGGLTAGLQAGYILIGLCALVCALCTVLLCAYLKKRGQPLL